MIVGVPRDAGGGDDDRPDPDLAARALQQRARPELPAPSFVLFVGDVDADADLHPRAATPPTGPTAPSTRDLVPDMYYGRFSATNPTQLQAILDKTLMYDQFTMPDPELSGRGGDDRGHGRQLRSGLGQRPDQLRDEPTTSTPPTASSATPISTRSRGARPPHIVQNVSDGVAYVNYTAHGSQTSLVGSRPSPRRNVNSLQNAGEYCLAVGNCCLTSSYEVRASASPRPGSGRRTRARSATSAARNSTYWDEDYWWGVGYGQHRRASRPTRAADSAPTTASSTTTARR